MNGSNQSKDLAVILVDCGLISYQKALEKQRLLVAEVVAGDCPGALMVLEHEPVLSFGRHADRSFLLASRDELAAQGVSLVESDRGGEITAHMPGQLVIYPILPVRTLGLGPKSLVTRLLAAVVNCLATFDIASHIDEENPGVWVDSKKICAVGIRIKQRVSMHGIALNVNNSLALFEAIVPCGIRDRGVTSVALESSRADPCQVRQRLIRQITQSLGISLLA